MRLGASSNPQIYKTSIQTSYGNQQATDSLLPITHNGVTGVHHNSGYSANSRVLTYTAAGLRELLPPDNQQIYVHSQYQYLLSRLHEVKRHRPPSTTVSESDATQGNKCLVSSSCYSSLLDIDSSIPCENQFIGDSCQGGVPNQCETISLCEEIDTENNYCIRQYTSSKSTLPSVESANMSPRVSELDLVSTDSSKQSSRKHSPHSRKVCGHCDGKGMTRKSSLKSRTVRFRDPESEVLSSADDDVTSCECEPCHSCKNKYNNFSISE